MTNDMTKGNVYKTLFGFTIPILLSNLLQQLYGFADSVIVSWKLGDRALAAVGASFQISNIILAVSMGLTIGTSILISKMYGAKKIKSIQKAVDTGMFLCCLLGAVISITGILFSKEILTLFNVPKDILKQSAGYLSVIYIGTLPSFCYNAVTNYLRGVGDSKTALYFLLLSSVLNIILDFLLVWIIPMGVIGAAIATVISQFASFFGLLWYTNRSEVPFRIKLVHLKIDYSIMKEALRIGIPASLQQLMIGVGSSVIQYLINGYGSTVIAAYTAASKIEGFAVLPAVNIGKSISNYIAQNKGAGEEERVKKGIKAGVIMIIVISLLLTILILFYAGTFMKLFSSNDEVCSIGIKYLRMVGLFYIIFGIMQLLNGVLLGVGKANLSLIGSVVSFCAIQVPVAILLSYKTGVLGIWLAAPIGWIAGMLLRAIFVNRSIIK
jgi:putative MATE family efflux protein